MKKSENIRNEYDEIQAMNESNTGRKSVEVNQGRQHSGIIIKNGSSINSGHNEKVSQHIEEMLQKKQRRVTTNMIGIDRIDLKGDTVKIKYIGKGTYRKTLFS